jgi:MoaA/NifB/PqqE/SkfB family radical SAM enzyme
MSYKSFEDRHKYYDVVPDLESRDNKVESLWRDDTGKTMFEYERVDRLELEFNNTCFLYCGGCGRTFNHKIEEAGKKVIELENIKRFFPPEFCKQLRWFLSCGNYGEPAAHPDCLDILRWFRDNGTRNVSFSSNGSSRDPKFWAEAAEIINGPGGSRGNIKNWGGGRVTFSIDGLEDTNHLYRIGAKWDKLMANTEAFINAGGRARWQMITFNHNAHQVQQAKDRAKELGFSEFIEKMSFRFLPVRMGKRHAEQLADNAEFQMIQEKEAREREKMENFSNTDSGRIAHSKDILEGMHSRKEKMGGIIEHPINIPNDPSLRHPDREMLAEQRTKGTKGVKGKDHFSQKHKIVCQNRTEPRIYVSFDGKIWPCNWLGGIEYYERDDNPYKQHWPIPSLLHHNVPLDFNNLHNEKYKDDPNPVKTILESPWYSHLLEEDWMRGDDPEGSLQPAKCKQMCHTELGTGIFEKMRRNEQNLLTGEYSDVNKVHGLTPPQGGSGWGPGSAMEVDPSKQIKVEDVVASENYDSKIVDEDDIRLYKYYKEVSPGKFKVSFVDDERKSQNKFKNKLTKKNDKSN